MDVELHVSRLATGDDMTPLSYGLDINMILADVKISRTIRHR